MFAQAEKELKEELEVKLALSSLVCAVADNASTQRLEQGSSDVVRLEEKLRRAEAVESEGGLRAELAKTNAVVASLQGEINSARGWQTGVDDLKLTLMSQIEELKVKVQVRQINEQQALGRNQVSRKSGLTTAVLSSLNSNRNPKSG